MARINRNNIDKKTNKPNPAYTEGYRADSIHNRKEIQRRDDDVIRTPKRTLYDIDYAIKWYIENKIRPQVTSNKNIIAVPVIFSNGEKWDNVQRLGYTRDEKGKLQSPIIMLKRNSATERDNHRGLDVNNTPDSNYFVYRNQYNSRNRYQDTLFPNPFSQPVKSNKLYIVDIPKYVNVEYEILIWCDFTTQLNDVIDQVLPHNRYSWGQDFNQFESVMGGVNFETINTIGEDRLTRATIPLTVKGTLLAEHEVNTETIKKRHSIKKVIWNVEIQHGQANSGLSTNLDINLGNNISESK